MEHHLVLRVVAKLLLPLVLLFALYVQFHGDFGPGGGFQAGVIFAAGFILYGLIFGTENLCQIAQPKMVQTIAAFGVVLYLAVGVAGLMLGGSFLDYGVLSNDPVHGQHLGIFFIELGVGMTVGAVMVIFFLAFSPR